MSARLEEEGLPDLTALGRITPRHSVSWRKLHRERRKTIARLAGLGDRRLESSSATRASGGRSLALIRPVDRADLRALPPRLHPSTAPAKRPLPLVRGRRTPPRVAEASRRSLQQDDRRAHALRTPLSATTTSTIDHNITTSPTARAMNQPGPSSSVAAGIGAARSTARRSTVRPTMPTALRSIPSGSSTTPALPVRPNDPSRSPRSYEIAPMSPRSSVTGAARARTEPDAKVQHPPTRAAATAAARDGRHHARTRTTTSTAAVAITATSSPVPQADTLRGGTIRESKVNHPTSSRDPVPDTAMTSTASSTSLRTVRGRCVARTAAVREASRARAVAIDADAVCAGAAPATASWLGTPNGDADAPEAPVQGDGVLGGGAVPNGDAPRPVAATPETSGPEAPNGSNVSFIPNGAEIAGSAVTGAGGVACVPVRRGRRVRRTATTTMSTRGPTSGTSTLIVTAAHRGTPAGKASARPVTTATIT
ncbi:hypothetical protein C5C33_07105 [Rathayibacter sp. AY1H3]|nr:hypothetical protein C5C33_07105 [Rathayibacter sp. AY1H3]